MVVALVVVIVLMPAAVVHIVLHANLSVGVVVVRHYRHYPHQRAEHQKQIGYVLGFLHRGFYFSSAKIAFADNLCKFCIFFFRIGF